MDEYTVARLSNQGVRLLFALVLTGQTVIRLSRTEILSRAKLNKNTIEVAKRELHLLGYITYERDQITLLHDSPVVVVRPVSPPLIPESTILDGVFSPIRTPREMCEQAKTPVEREEAILAAFAGFFPEEQVKYPLQKTTVKTWLGLVQGSTQQLYDTIERVATRKPNHPKAYIASVLKSQPDTPVVEEKYVPSVDELAGLKKLQAVLSKKGK